MPETVAIVGVASPYAWEIVESARRLGLSVTTIDNVGSADVTLPGLHYDPVPSDLDRGTIVGVASAQHRFRALHAAYSLGFSNPVWIADPTATMPSTAVVGHMAFINAGAVVGANTRIDCAANVNRLAAIGESAVIGMGASIGPGAVVGARSLIAPRAAIGAGAIVMDGLRVGEGAYIAPGSVVTEAVPDFAVVAGNPGQRMAPQEPWAVGAACPYCINA